MQQLVISILVIILAVSTTTHAMSITINTVGSSGDSFSIEVEASDTIDDMKQLIQSVNGKTPSQQRLIYAGQVLQDSKDVSFYKMQDGDSVALSLRSRRLGATYY